MGRIEGDDWIERGEGSGDEEGYTIGNNQGKYHPNNKSTCEREFRQALDITAFLC